MKTLLALLLGLTLAPLAAAQSSFIHITFADPAIAPIHVVGQPTDVVYGVSDPPALARAKARAVLDEPPPAPELFARSSRLESSQLQAQTSGPVRLAGYGLPPTAGLSRERDTRRTLEREENRWQSVPAYDLAHFYARLEEWRRQRAQAYLLLGGIE